MSSSIDCPQDSLLSIQLRIARLADEFARQRPRSTPLNLQCWLLAEAEVWGRRIRDAHEPGAPASLAMP